MLFCKHFVNIYLSTNYIWTNRKSKSRKGNSVADQILQNSPESCKVRIVCEGKEVNEQMMMSPSPRTSANDTSSMTSQKKEDHHDSVSCICFIPKFK